LSPLGRAGLGSIVEVTLDAAQLCDLRRHRAGACSQQLDPLGDLGRARGETATFTASTASTSAIASIGQISQ